MERVYLLFHYFKEAWLRSAALNFFFALFSFVIAGITLWKINPDNLGKALICLSTVLVVFCWLLIQAAYIAVSEFCIFKEDVRTPKISMAIAQSAFKNKFDVVFLTEKPACPKLFKTGTYISLVEDVSGCEQCIGCGCVVNEQTDGKLHVAFVLYDDFKSRKSEIERNTKNISFIPYNDVGGLYEGS